MAYPKGFKKNIKLVKDKVGFPRRQEILDDIANKDTHLPKGVMYEDMDKSFIDFVKEDLKLIVEGEVVPVIFLTLQRWSEFSQTWQKSDKYKNLKIPFITIVRKPNPQVGQNQGGLFNIPGKRTYTYMKIPTFEGGREGIDTYKIPQPTSVDISYEIRLFSNKMRDLNKFNIKIQKLFNSIQHYLRVNGHPMPLLLEDIGDESKTSDFESRRYFIQPFSMRLQGYVLDEDDFEIVPTVNRMMVVSEIITSNENPRFRLERVGQSDDGSYDEYNYYFNFRPNSRISFTYNAVNNTEISEFISSTNVDSYELSINNVTVFSGLVIDGNNPIKINVGDRVNIKIIRNDSTLESKVVLKGFNYG